MADYDVPCFWIPEPERDALEQCVHADVRRTPPPLSRDQRTELSERLATEATLELLEHAAKGYRVDDANALRRNQPGYDLIVDGRVRVQVKGCTFVETIEWRHRISATEKSLQFDFLVAVDLGITLDGSVGRLTKKLLSRKDCADYYIVPGDVVHGWISEGRRITKMGAHIYMYKYPLKAGTKEERGQTRELAAWLNRVDVLKDAVRS